MFDQSKGTIDSKKNRRLRDLIRKRKKKQEIHLQEEKREKDLIEKKKKEFYIPKNIPSQEKREFITSNNTRIKRNNINKKGKIRKEKKESTSTLSKEIVEKISKPKEADNQHKEIKDKIKQEMQEDTTNQKEKKVKNKSIHSSNKTKTLNHNDQPIKIVKHEKNLLELALVNEFEVILKDHQYDLNKLIVEFNILNKQVDETVETEEIERISDEIDDLVKKLEIIKKELELLTNSATFKDIYKLHDPYLTNLIDEYKDTIIQNKQLLNTVNELENDSLYISIVNKILEFETKKEKLTNKLTEVCEKYEIRDENFEKWKDSYIDIEKITKSLDQLVIISDQKLKEIEDKVSKSVHVTEIVETRMKSSLGILAKTMLIMSLLKKNPTRQANGLTAITTLTAINLVNDLIKPKKITTKRFETDLTDYKNMINNTISDVEDILLLINKGISEIQSLKLLFEKEFKEYQYDIPEYKEFIDKLDNIEKEMFGRQTNMNKISHELQYQYDKNNAKVKKYDHLS